MTVYSTVESMLDQIAELSGDQRDELLLALAEMRREDLGVEKCELSDTGR